MAPNVSINKNKGKTLPDDSKQMPKIGVDSNTAGGGVWAQTSAKRDKLGELKIELDWDNGQKTLDDMATSEQALDLWLVDGIRTVVMAVDEGLSLEQGEKRDGAEALLLEFESRLKEFEELLGNEQSKEPLEITKAQFDSHIDNMIGLVTQLRAEFDEITTSEKSKTESKSLTESNSDNVPPQVLLHLRDFLPRTTDPNMNTSIRASIPTNLATKLHPSGFDQIHRNCQVYYRLLLLEMALRHSSTQWDALTTPSSADTDRAATRGEILKPKTTLPLKLLHEVWWAFGTKSCQERVEAIWNLWDSDGDTMLDQEEMDKVVYASVTPVEDAIRQFVCDSVEVWPLRSGLPPCILTDDIDNNANEKKRGWYTRWKDGRTETKCKKKFVKLLDMTLKKHFEVEVETPHRLRCCYAWAEKEHQDGKVESVLVDASGDSSGSESSENGTGGTFFGRKRYVELDPKISYPEFREVQIEHYPHLDKVSDEICQSFKEELWVHQGKGRQNEELKREISMFLVVVGLIDIAIIMA